MMSVDPSSSSPDDPPAGTILPIEAVPPPLPTVARAFCSRCGTRIDLAAGAGCSRCAPIRVAAAVVVPDGVADDDLPPIAMAIAVPAPELDEARAIRSAFTLYFTLLAICLAATVYAIASSGNRTDLQAQFVTSGVITLTTIGFAVRWRDDFATPLRHAGRPIYYLAAVGLGACTFAVASAALHLLSRGLGIEQLRYLPAYERAGFGIGLAILAIAVQPAVIEEIAFRGILFAALRRLLGPAETIVVVALLFGILHLSIPSLFHLTLLGLALGWLRLRSGSLYPCMLMHFTHNLLVMLDERYRWMTWS